MMFISLGYKKTVRLDAITGIQESSSGAPANTIETIVHLAGTTITVEGRHHDRIVALMADALRKLSLAQA